jgi:hypothetical protein
MQANNDVSMQADNAASIQADVAYNEDISILSIVYKNLFGLMGQL